ncbi:MAG TPA: hypothetical protein VHB97_07320 [Polyangia bacterium]|jgi:hypothetical protein|nr:hypothetical protein [Polyangia bacterium]
MKWTLAALLPLVLVGCARSTDAINGANRDLSAVGGNGADGDLGAPADLTPDLTSVSDLASPALADLTLVSDLARPPALADLTVESDLAQSSSDVTVQVLIDNFCNSSTSPTVITAPLHVALDLTFVNDSHDYDADIWSSRGYGYLGLVQGGVWHDPIQHCLDPNPYTEYFDVGIAGGPVGNSCPNYRLEIHCN